MPVCKQDEAGEKEKERNMNSIGLESVSENRVNMDITVNKIKPGSGWEKAGKTYVCEAKSQEKREKFMSKNGDTLELSAVGKKISDSVLMGYSKVKLKQLYSNQKISKQQYDRIIKRQDIQE